VSPHIEVSELWSREATHHQDPEQDQQNEIKDTFFGCSSRPHTNRSSHSVEHPHATPVALWRLGDVHAPPIGRRLRTTRVLGCHSSVRMSKRECRQDVKLSQSSNVSFVSPCRVDLMLVWIDIIYGALTVKGLTSFQTVGQVLPCRPLDPVLRRLTLCIGLRRIHSLVLLTTLVPLLM